MRPSTIGAVMEPAYTARYAGHSASLGVARRALLGWLADRGVDEELSARAALVLSELCTNAMQAAPDHDIEVRASEADGQICVMVVGGGADERAIPARERWSPVFALAQRGRGLQIVESLATSVVIDRVDGRVAVAATLAATDVRTAVRRPDPVTCGDPVRRRHASW